MNPYRELLAAMNEAGIRYLVVGGVAVNLHGYRRFTADVDVAIALEEQNLERLSALMRRLGYTERLPVPVTALKDARQVQQWIEEKGMTAYSFLSNDPLRINVDVLAGASLRFADYDARKCIIELGDGLGVPVIAIEDLLAMKREADRPVDRQDIEMLLEFLTS